MSKPFYRIENKTSKIGPYRHITLNKNGHQEWFSNIVFEECGRRVGTSVTNCPTLTEEGVPYSVFDKPSARYGFRSLSKLKRWFGANKKVFACMEKHGFVLRRYEVDEQDIFSSPTQSIVNIEELHTFTELPFSTLIPKKKTK